MTPDRRRASRTPGTGPGGIREPLTRNEGQKAKSPDPATPTTDPKTQKRCAIYCRVSTTDQTVDNQLLALRRYAVARDWTVAAEYTDAGVSGRKASRPALDRMLVDATAGAFDVVLIVKLDRLGRSLQHLMDLASKLKDRGVALVSVNDGFDLSTPNGRLQFNMLAAFAEFELDIIKERTLAGHARARAEGKKIGGANRIEADFEATRDLSFRKAAAVLGVSMSTVRNRRKVATA